VIEKNKLTNLIVDALGRADRAFDCEHFNTSLQYAMNLLDALDEVGLEVIRKQDEITRADLDIIYGDIGRASGSTPAVFETYGVKSKKNPCSCGSSFDIHSEHCKSRFQCATCEDVKLVEVVKPDEVPYTIRCPKCVEDQ
jgi:hypothetical protein